MLIKLLLLICTFKFTLGQYEPTWESLDAREIPGWYDKAKIGIFLHWGVYSVPSFGKGQESAFLWLSWKNGDPTFVDYMEKNYPPGWTYQDFAPSFTAEFFNPDEWADLFRRSGAKYIVLTSKHHEGYALWPSKFSYSWNAMDVGPRRDLVGDLATAVRSHNLTFGLYHSLYEWFHPLYDDDQANGWSTSNFVNSKIIPEMRELIENYKPDLLWSDGDWDAPDTYWQSREFLTWLYNDSPVKETIVTNDRWGQGIMCNHGGFLTCADRYNPGHLMPKKWENAMTLDRYSWGFRRDINIPDILSIEELLSTVVGTISCGGNILINVGPTKEGTIIPAFQERLTQLGSWLDINGEAIYETVPWTAQNDTSTSGVWYTAKDSNVYAMTLEWPENNVLSLGAAPSAAEIDAVTLLGNEEIELEWEEIDGQLNVNFPNKAVVVSQWAWSLKITLS